MSGARRFVVDIVDAGGLESVAQALSALRALLRADAQEECVNLVVKCLAVLEHAAIYGVEIVEVDAAGSAESAYVGKFVEIVECGVEGEQSTP